jgi:hypothetical protein
LRISQLVIELVRSRDQREEKAQLHLPKTPSTQVAALPKVHQVYLKWSAPKTIVKKEPGFSVRQSSTEEKLTFQESGKDLENPGRTRTSKLSPGALVPPKAIMNVEQVPSSGAPSCDDMSQRPENCRTKTTKIYD